MSACLVAFDTLTCRCLTRIMILNIDQSKHIHVYQNAPNVYVPKEALAHVHLVKLMVACHVT